MMTIQQTFASARTDHRLQLMPFVPAGYPSLEATAATLPALAAAGAGLIEVGIPFSDPVADGPVIQEAFTDALAAGIKLADICRTVQAVSKNVSVPLVAMVSFSVAFRVGVKAFAEQLKTAGFDGLILPDLPPPEAARFVSTIRDAGLDTSLLIAPTTSEARRQEIASLTSGFIYYLSVAGVTGERTSLPADLTDNLAALHKLTNKPLCVGFGLSKREHLDALRGHADGAIVGSAIVRRMKAAGTNPEAVASAAAELCRELLS